MLIQIPKTNRNAMCPSCLIYCLCCLRVDRRLFKHQLVASSSSAMAESHRAGELAPPTAYVDEPTRGWKQTSICMFFASFLKNWLKFSSIWTETQLLQCNHIFSSFKTSDCRTITWFTRSLNLSGTVRRQNLIGRLTDISEHWLAVETLVRELLCW